MFIRFTQLLLLSLSCSFVFSENVSKEKKVFTQQLLVDDPIAYAKSLNASDWAIPAWTTLLAKLKYAEMGGENFKEDLKKYLQVMPSKEIPYSIVATYNGDPRYGMGVAWFTNEDITEGILQVTAIDNATDKDFENSPIEFLATSTPLKNMPYMNSTSDQAYWTGLVGSKKNYTSHKALATNLKPNTTYSYRVGKNKAWSKIRKFKTAPDNTSAFNFIYVTDTQSAQTPEFNTSRNTVLKAVENTPDAQFVLITGDLVETKGDGNSEWEYEQWLSLMDTIISQKPIVPTIGNHDVTKNKNFFHHFNTNNSYNETSMVPSTMGGATYSFVIGNALFYVIDYEDYGKAGYLSSLSAWMLAQKKAHPGVNWRIACSHRSLYTGSSTWHTGGDGVTLRASMQPVYDIIGIDLALQGHDHVYEVIGPVNSKKQVIAGTVKDIVDSTPKPTENMNGKSGGTFTVGEGTLFFLNGSASGKKYNCSTQEQMVKGAGATGITDFWSLFTGRFGQNYLPAFSQISVTSDTITISTFSLAGTEVKPYDTFRVVKPKDESAISHVKEDVKYIYDPYSQSIESIEEPFSRIEIFNTTGQLLHVEENISTLSLSSYKKGVYIFRIQKEGTYYSQRILL